jgi:hypothetical protein
MALINVPNSGQTLGGTRASVNSNFSTINNAFSVDHVAMTAPGIASPQGFHMKVTLPVNPSAPVIGTNNGIYNLQSSITGLNEIFMHFQKQTGTLDIPITASIRSTVNVPTPVSTVGQGWCYLVSGLIMKWGTFITTAANPYLFPTAANIPVFSTAVLSFQISVVNTGIPYGGVINCFNITTTGFNWAVTGAAPSLAFSYLAIGY